MLKKITLFILVLFFITGCTNDNTKQTKEKSINISIYNNEASLLVLLAKEKGYFKKENLNVELTKFSTGRDALKAMAEGKFDYSTATEYVAVKNSFTNKNIQTITSIAKSDISGALINSNSNINFPEDIKGKKVGTTKGTVVEFYTGMFLDLHSISKDEIQTVTIQPKDREDYFLNSKVDVLFAWEPTIYKLQKQANVKYYPLPRGFKLHLVLCSSKTFNHANPNISTKILKALYQAQEYIKNNPKGVREFLKKEFNYEDDYIYYILKKYSFELSNDITMKLLMQRQGNWLISNKLVTAKEFDPMEIINIDLLKDLYPNKNTIIK